MIFGQPKGLATLFLTEMWERFTYYGMRAVLILFLVAHVADGGLGLDDRTASAIYGLYIAMTYVLALFGGWMADRLLGAQRAVFAGGCLILAGNTLLAVTGGHSLLAGLMLNVIGVGLLKPNISVLVGGLYPEGGARRDAAFSIFYMGISVGAFLGSILVPIMAALYGWRWGFLLPAITMVFGLAQFLWTRRWLGGAGLTVETPGPTGPRWAVVVVAAVALVVFAALGSSGRLSLDPVALSAFASWAIALAAAGYFVYLIFFAGLDSPEQRRIYVILVLFIGYALFYAGFEQGGASLNLFAERYTQRHIFGWEIPAGVFQSITPLVTILFAPVFAWLWLALGRRGKDPAPSIKFAMGLSLLGISFAVMFIAAQGVLAGEKVLPVWLIVTYVLQEWGDLCLSPVGLSWMTKLAPPRFVGQIMGIWFLSLALGNSLAGQLSQQYDASQLQSLPRLFSWIGIGAIVAALIMVLLTRWIREGLRGVK